MTSLLAVLFFLLGASEAGELTQVKVFVGNNHAQLLLVGTEGFNRPGTQSAAAVGTAPARAQVKIRGAELSDSLREDYAESHGRWLIPVNRKGVRQVALSHVGDTLHVALESDQKRVVEVREIAEAALLVDFLVEGEEPDSSLPSQDCSRGGLPVPH